MYKLPQCRDDPSGEGDAEPATASAETVRSVEFPTSFGFEILYSLVEIETRVFAGNERMT
jgi:hypothetical protein